MQFLLILYEISTYLECSLVICSGLENFDYFEGGEVGKTILIMKLINNNIKIHEVVFVFGEQMNVFIKEIISIEK